MKNLLFFPRFFLTVFFAPIFFACNFFDQTESAEFFLPYDGEWKIRTSRIPSEEFFVNGKIFRAEVEKNCATAILAYDENSVHPFGAIYPYTGDLDECGGFAAEVLFSLTVSAENSDEEKSEFLSKFNWARFLDECRKFGSDVWKLDKEKIMQKISSGSFKKTDFKMTE